MNIPKEGRFGNATGGEHDEDNDLRLRRGREKNSEEVLQPDGSWSVATASYGYDQIDRLVSEN